MGIEQKLKSGRFLGIDDLKQLVGLRKEESKDIRRIVRERQANAQFENPKANVEMLIRGAKLIEKSHPDHARLINAMLLLTIKFQRTHEEALEIVSRETKKTIEFVSKMEKDAIKCVMDALESSRIIQIV